jgi:xanthine dehydrogenase accessory factor
MNDNEYIARTVCEKMGNSSSLVLVSIVSIQGSSPRHHGTKMVVDEQGKSYGTIGGSLLEATAINEAVTVLSKKQSRLTSFDLTGDNAYSKDMICGGKAEILLDFIPANKENLDLFTAVHDMIRAGRDFYFLTAYRDHGRFADVFGHTLFTSDGKAIGNYSWKDSDLDLFKSESKGLSTTTILQLEDIRVVMDPIKKIETLFCFGAGHVAMPTAHVAALAGFRIVVVDDRVGYANKERFPDADELCIINDFNHALKGLTIDADSYIVIVTRGHAFDRIVLAEALKTKAGYIGMISSRRKREAIYQALMEEGVSKDALARVHSPIGIPIGGETPAEIAISIVAELISERYKKKT